VTAEGRLIRVGLMVVGIGFIGVFTATLTSFFLEPAKLADQAETIEQRLDRIERKLDVLLTDQRHQR
jgi:hypothetical protein